MLTLRSLVRSPLIRFLLAGGFAAASNYGSRFVFERWVPFEWAIVLAYLVGMTVAFVLMRQAVFDAKHGALSQQIPRFVLINLLAVAQTWVISVWLARSVLPALNWPLPIEASAHLVGVLVPVVTSYLGHKWLTFRAPARAPASQHAPEAGDR